MGVRRLSLVLCLAATAAGCLTVGPDYEAPTTELPDAWHQAAAADLGAGSAALETWWTVFEDPVLSDLIERARTGNRQLEVAVGRIEEARALLAVAGGGRLPQVGVSGSSSRQQPSDNGLTPAPQGGFDPVSLHDYGMQASWEIDLFGGIRRAVEAAEASLMATTEAYRDVLVSVLAEVATSYVDVRANQERLRLARFNVLAQEETLNLTRDRFDAGLVSGLDVAQAESNLATTRSLIPLLEASLELGLNRLAVLLGVPPGELHAELTESPSGVPEAVSKVAFGLPLDLLRQRPDIRAAERAVAAQNARIGVATAELYPTFSLSGLIGLQATSAGDLASGDSLVWGVSLPVRWNIFAGGRLRAQIRAEEARTAQAVAQWEAAVLAALQEVENAVVSLEQERLRRQQLVEAVAATERAQKLVLTQYRAGLADFQNVLDIQRSLLQLHDELAVSEGREARYLIGVYRGLGGGWDPAAPPLRADEHSHVRSNEGEPR